METIYYVLVGGMLIGLNFTFLLGYLEVCILITTTVNDGLINHITVALYHLEHVSPLQIFIFFVFRSTKICINDGNLTHCSIEVVILLMICIKIRHIP